MCAKVKQVLIKKVELKKLRKKAGLTYGKLAELSGVSIPQICQYENDVWIMEQETWDKIVKVLDKHIK